MSPKIQKQLKEVDPQKDVIACATYFPLRHWWDLLSFFRMSNRVQRQLDQTPGVIKYALRLRLTDLLRKRYYTYSIWADRASLNAFMRVEPHVTPVHRLASDLAKKVFWPKELRQVVTN